MGPAESIRAAVAQVSRLREEARLRPELGLAVARIKQFQSQRFAGTYADLALDPRYRAATRFFLEQLYGEASYVERDAQFSRVAGALQRLLPKPAVASAVALAQLHALSERLDHAMGEAWLTSPAAPLIERPQPWLRQAPRGGARKLGSGPAFSCDETVRYVHAWRSVGRRAERESQLRAVLGIGNAIDGLTRTRGLRTILMMMRGPAFAAGLGALQGFLESGFDTFADMGKHRLGAQSFLAVVEERESHLISALFDADFDTSCGKLDHDLHAAP